MRGKRENQRPGEPESQQESVKATRRKARVPLGVPKQKLAVPKRAGFQRRWINDDGGRLHQALEGDWKFVEDPTLKVGDDDGNSDVGSRVSRIVGKKKTGQPLRAFLMEIEDEFYQEDQEQKLASVREMERQIKRGNVHNSGSEHRYIPDQGHGIKIDDAIVRVGTNEE